MVTDFKKLPRKKSDYLADMLVLDVKILIRAVLTELSQLGTSDPVKCFGIS